MRAQVLLGIFDNSGQVLAQVDGLSCKGDAAFQQESANLVNGLFEYAAQLPEDWRSRLCSCYQTVSADVV